MERTTLKIAEESDDGYPQLEELMRRRIAATKGKPVFTTAAKNLFQMWLHSLPPERRQHYNCRTCEAFFNNFANLVTVDEGGTVKSVLWEPEDVPPFFTKAVEYVRHTVVSNKINGIFISSEKDLGVKEKGGWSHLAGPNPNVYVPSLTENAYQKSARLSEDYGILSRAIAEFTEFQVSEAVRVLESDLLKGSEVAVKIGQWFLKIKQTKNKNLIWLAVATAPPGWCHIRTTMIGTLLEDLAAGFSFEIVKKKWNEKMHPLQYQRPQAAPTDGQVAEAERLFEKSGAARSLERRFADITDVLEFVWRPRTPPVKAEAGSVFGHLKTKDVEKRIELPAQTLTWEKFLAKVVPGIESLEIHAPYRGGYYGLLTACHPDAPPIIQWDGLEGHPRNPVSWYYWTNGSDASDWGISSGWNKVNGIFLAPHRWQDPAKFDHHGDHVFFAIEGAKGHKKPSLGLFPSIIKTDYRGVRSTIEAHSNSRNAEGLGTANGLAFQKDKSVTVRVNGDSKYTIDRWE